MAYVSINMSMFLFNMLPILPLDGGRIVFNIGYYLFPVAQLINLLTAMGRVAGAFLVLFSVLGLLNVGRLNFSMMAAGVYILCCAGRQREVLYAGAFHTALQERMREARHAQVAQIVVIQGNEYISSIIPILCRSNKCVFAVEHNGELRFIEESQVLGKLISMPKMTFTEAFLDQQ